MEAKYIGDQSQFDESVPEVFRAHGVTFNKGKFSKVPAELEGKFAGNPHFEVKGGAKSDAGKEAVAANEQAEANEKAEAEAAVAEQKAAEKAAQEAAEADKK